MAAFIVVAIIAAIVLVTAVRSQAAEEHGQHIAWSRPADTHR
ncbi:MAG: hypothetical protein WAV00_00875 [Nocardioides sp.]